MTKTTNYEISKKLAEIGFNKETNFYFTEIAPDKFEAQYYTNNKEYLLLKSYDLETLLDALPSKIKGIEGECWFNIHFRMNKHGLWYENLCNCDSDQSCPVESYCHIEIKENESLADIAGKMLILLLILLHEKNLIKF
jgi:hypothetical protein